MRLLAAGVLSLAVIGSALAHATLETTEAPADSTYKGVIRIGHGCEGKPTQAVRVRIPEGVIVAKPMPKAGWQLATVKGAYAKSYDYYGTPVSEGVTEIAWTGGDLPDDWYDEFVFRARLTDFPVGSIVYFPIVLFPDRPGMRRWCRASVDRDSRSRKIG
jgi:uncharacterized protein YcnI